MNKSDKRKNESATMRFLRSVAEFTLLDFKGNTDIQNHYNAYNSKEEAEKQKESW
jgi:hypothetical protein